MNPPSVRLERLVYTMAAPALAAVPNIAPEGAVNGGILTAGVVSVGGMLFAFKGDAGAGQKLLRLSPPAAALVVDLVATNTTGWYWGADALLAAGWATTFGMLLPWSHKARRRARAALARASEPVAAITPGPAVPTPAVPTPALPIPGAANDAFTVQVRQRKGVQGFLPAPWSWWQSHTPAPTTTSR